MSVHNRSRDSILQITNADKLDRIPRKAVPSLTLASGAPTVVNAEKQPEPWLAEIEKGEGTRRTDVNEDTLAALEPPKPKKTFLGPSMTFPEFRSNGKAPLASPNRASRPLSMRFGQEMAGQKRYFGLSRNSFFLSIAALVLVVLGVVIGLAVGLKKIPRSKNLPLPTNKEVHTGDLTYYMPGLGACGITNTDSDSIVAISHEVFDAVQKGSDPNQNPLCGKKIRASRFDEKVGEQRSVDLTVTDRCVGCKPTDIDVTTSVFDQLADRDAGRVTTTWAWLDVDM